MSSVLSKAVDYCPESLLKVSYFMCVLQEL